MRSSDSTASRPSSTGPARAPPNPSNCAPSSPSASTPTWSAGFTGHGPHRDDVATLREGRELRAYGSQGQQRLGLLALLLAERAALAQRRQTPPVMLLDDVMSELDGRRRRALVDLLRSGGGQAVITATDAEQVPGADEPGVHRLEVLEGGRLTEAVAA